MLHQRLDHRFVSEIPEAIDPGILYISMEYTTAAHSCCCGCGEEVVTPFSPTDWRMTFDGDSVSLHPSIGNWTLSCRSHYIIRNGEVIEAKPWTEKQIDTERQRDRAAKRSFYNKNVSGNLSISTPEHSSAQDHSSWWQRMWKRLSRG